MNRTTEVSTDILDIVEMVNYILMAMNLNVHGIMTL